MTVRFKHLNIALVAAFACSTVLGQGTAQISGRVTDATGALIPGADVQATQTDTGLTRSTVTNETGAYALPSLPTGPYRLEVTLPGFQTFVQTGITLEVNGNPEISVVLQVGQVTQTVEVTANTALVETRTVGVGNVMENERILELPLNGRNVTQLILNAGAAVQTGTSSRRSMPNQQEISVAGSQEGSVAYMLDGAIHNNPYDNLSLPLPFPDALQEFKVETSALSASQGRLGGAQVNAVTKSGTNVVNGSLFWFVRNDLFGAKEYFTGQSSLKRNQFGGTVGGPIVQDKLFYFAAFQGTTIRQDPSGTEDWAPTPAMLRGDFRAVTAPPCSRSPITLSYVRDGVQLFENNMIDPAHFSPVGVELARRSPMDQIADECGLVQFGNLQQDNDTQWVGKTDWQVNDAHSIIGRVLYQSNNRETPYSLDTDNIFTADAPGWDSLGQSYTVGDTWLVSPTTVVSSRLAVNYTNIGRLGADYFTWADLGANVFSYVDKYANLGITDPGFNLGGATSNDSSFRTFSAGLNTDVSMSRGDHQWSYGGAYMWIDSNSNANAFASGQFNFNGQHSGLPYADMLLGVSQRFLQGPPNTAYVRQLYTALYLADTWRVTPTLTLNWGLRWEPELGQSITNGRIATFSNERRMAGVRSTVFTQAPPGFLFPGDEGFEGDRGRPRNMWIFAPRFGLAWDVTGDGRTSVRASTGLGYDYPNAQFHLWTSLVPPFGGNIVINGASLDDPWADYPGGNPHPLSVSSDVEFPTYGRFTFMGEDMEPAQVQSWNLSLQRQFADDWLVSATYLGMHTIHMLGSEQVNPAIYFPGVADAGGLCYTDQYTFNAGRAGATCSTTRNTNPRRLLSIIDPEVGRKMGAAAQINTDGNMSYNGLLLDVRKRISSGYTLNLNYTWAHCLSLEQDSENGGTGLNPDNVNIFPGDRNRTRGNCSSDRRQALNLTSVAQMPEFENAAARMLASGWQLSVIYRYNTGSYMTIEAGSDRALNGTNRGDQVAQHLGGEPLSGRNGPREQYFNVDNFAIPAAGTLGNVGIRSIRGPAQWDWDAALSRNFTIAEGQTIEFRWEVYNIPNSFRAVNPSFNRRSGTFGQLRNSRDPRVMQFALKWNF